VLRENVRVIRDKALARQNVNQGVSHTAASHGRGVPNCSAVYDSGNYHDKLTFIWEIRKKRMVSSCHQ